MHDGKKASLQSVVKFLKKMNPIEKKVACLYYFEDLGSGDIANVLGVEEKFVQRLLEKFIANISLQLSETKCASKGISVQSK